MIGYGDEPFPDRLFPTRHEHAAPRPYASLDIASLRFLRPVGGTAGMVAGLVAIQGDRFW